MIALALHAYRAYYTLVASRPESVT